MKTPTRPQTSPKRQVSAEQPKNRFLGSNLRGFARLSVAGARNQNFPLPPKRFGLFGIFRMQIDGIKNLAQNRFEMRA